MTFDIQVELEQLKAQTRALRKKRFRTSRLDTFAGEIILLHRSGAKPAELQRWLEKKQIFVALSTITRWLKINGNIP